MSEIQKLLRIGISVENVAALKLLRNILQVGINSVAYDTIDCLGAGN